MTREEIIRMAQESGLKLGHSFAWSNLERFAAVVAAAERERCALVCEAEAEKWEGDDGPICAEARMCAVAIRARGDA